MILRDAIRYYELTGSDFQSDLENFSKLQQEYLSGNISDDFTERLDSFTDNLLELWVDNIGGWENALERKIDLPSTEQLINAYCRTIQPQEKEETNEVILLTDNRLLRKKRKEEENKTLDLIASLASADINFSQFLDLELEVIYKTLQLLGEKKKKQNEAAKKKKRKGF